MDDSCSSGILPLRSTAVGGGETYYLFGLPPYRMQYTVKYSDAVVSRHSV